MPKQKIRIKLRAFDHRILDQSAGQIVEVAEQTGAKVTPPMWTRTPGNSLRFAPISGSSISSSPPQRLSMP